VLAGGLVTLAVFLIHALVEGMRWQMVPAYLLLALTAAALLWRSGREAARRRGSLRKLISGTVRFAVLPVTLVLACYLPFAVPVFTIPEPSGRFSIGVRDFKLDFEDRPEIFTADEGDHRELMVRAWYPAEVAAESEPEPYFTKAEVGPLSEVLGPLAPVPWFFTHVTLVTTNSHRGAQLSPKEDRYPVLVFSHGYTSFFAQNTSLTEELASHGYVVFSLAHTYDGAAIFPDGRAPGLGEHVMRWTEESLEDSEEDFEQWTQWIEETDQHKRRVQLEEMIRRERERKAEGLGTGLSWDVWVEDRIRFFAVLEELQSGTRPSPFTGRLDLDRVGLFGMSFGGATAAEVCHIHPGCKAAINLDGGHSFGIDSTLLDGESTKPLMMLYASDGSASTPSASNPGDFQAHNDFHYETVATRGLRNDVIRIRVDGTSHLHISDMSLMMRFIPGFASPTPGERIAEILNRYCLAFFNTFVKGESGRSPLLDGPVAEFPEVTFQTFGHRLEDRKTFTPR
jgi:predicted dienelactone hydrolase